MDIYDVFTIKSPNAKNKSKTISTRTSGSTTSDLVDTDVFTNKPSKSSVSTTPSKSYRDRINERFNNVKEKAGKSSRKASGKDSAHKIRLEKLQKESKQLDIELENINQKHSKTSRLVEVTNFFYSTENVNHSSREDLIEKDETDLEFCKPQSERPEITLAENECFFRPNNLGSLQMIDKIDSDELRNLEGEGYYVSSPPILTKRQKNIVEQRLSRDDKKWFDCQGKLKIIENPVLNTSFRPSTLKAHPEDQVGTWLPPILGENLSELVVVAENILILQLSSLQFKHHPFFSIEHVFAVKLEGLFEKYEKIVNNNLLVRLEGRVESLRQTINLATKRKNDDKYESYCKNLKQIQEKLFSENKKYRDLLKDILHTWKNIKQIREQNTHTSTPHKVTIRKEKSDYESDKESYEKKFATYFDNYLLFEDCDEDDNEENVREKFKAKFDECFRSPGEPIISISLTLDENEITESVNDPKELIRRNSVSATKISLRILCNKIEVCKTKCINLDDDFKVALNEEITIQLSQIPKSLKIEILEQTRSLVKNTRAVVTVLLPPLNVSSKNAKNRCELFESDEIVNCDKHTGVGSGIKNNAYGDDLPLKTRGVLNCTLFWQKTCNKVQNKQESKTISLKTDKIIDKYGKIHLNELTEWIDQTKPDPQDPKNSILYENSLNNDNNSDEICLQMSGNNNYFRLDPYMHSLVFVDKSVIEENLRLKLLQLRNANEPEFDGVQIPLRLKELPVHLLENYSKRIAAENETLGLGGDDDSDDDEIEQKRMKGRQILKQIHIRVFQKCKNLQHNLYFEDVVDEKFVSYLQKLIKSLADNFINWFKWQPLKIPLLPILQKHQQEDLSTTITKQTKLIIQVICGLNVPARLDSENKNKVKPFVEIEYNNVVKKTATSDGKNPSWNETLSLDLDPIHLDYLNPNSMNGNVLIKLFDETNTILSKFENNVNKCVWLGSVEIPISGVGNDGLKGMFQLVKPCFMFNYESMYANKLKKGQNQQQQETFLNLSISLEPNVPKLSPSMDELPCGDLPYLKDYILKWNETYNMNFPSRKFSALILDSTGATNCLTRYIRAMEPPQINLQGFDVTAEQCARFVSLIPFTDCSQFYQNICLNLNEFLSIGIGSILDHAIALTCYLLSLKLDVWLLLGSGLPTGNTAYVLIKENNASENGMINYSIFDVVTGNKYFLLDTMCPLQKIYCVINEHNIWANIQRNDNIALTRFDLNRRSDWWPLFDKKNMLAPTNSVHNQISYLPKYNKVDELEIILDRKLRKTIRKLRHFDRTVWNHNISNAIKTSLSAFENIEMFDKYNSDALEKIKECIDNYHLNGYIFNLPFNGVSTICKSFKKIGIHLDELDSTEFASAVYIKSYMNNILSIWIFIGNIQIKKLEF